MKNLFFTCLVVGALAAAPNALWLMYSTVLVTNESDVLLYHVSLRVDEQSIPVGNIYPDSSRLAFLPTTFGEAALSIAYEVNGAPTTHCQEYVESSQYHVEVSIIEDQYVQCSAELPMTSALLVNKLF